MTLPWWSPTNTPAWDAGIRWHLEQSAAQAPDWTLDPLTVAFVRDQHLRSPNGSVEDEYIEWLLKVSMRAAERVTQRSLLPQSWALVMSGFPAGGIWLPRPPLVEVTSIAYLDADGDTTSLDTSPAAWQVETPGGPTGGRAVVYPDVGASWPSTLEASNAVTVTYEAGYPVVSGGVASIPEDITHGRLLMIAELYKQRSESTRGNVDKAMHVASSLWKRYTVYGS